MHKKYRPIRFPRDESVHDFTVEWWYFNGHLQDKEGNEYSFMDCLFRVDVKKIKVPFFSRLPLKIAFFSHASLTDLSRRKFYNRIAPYSVVSEDSFSRDLLYINYINPGLKNGYTNCIIERVNGKKLHIKNEFVDLELSMVKEPLLEGGKGFFDFDSKVTYYYSFTKLRTKGKIKINDKWIDVTGKSWMDHQWADSDYSLDKWNWFSFQLDNKTELVCFSYDNGKVKVKRADICYADGSKQHFKNVEIIPLKKTWSSQKTKAVYPVAWKIKIPQKGVELILKAKMNNQEMIFGSINYWEGAFDVKGKIGKEEVKGIGFMELVGYPSCCSSFRYIGEEIGRTTGYFINMAKNQAFHLVGNVKKRIVG